MKASEYRAKFPRRLKRYMGQLDLSVEELAHIIGVDRQSVYNWWKGKNFPSLDSAAALADALNISIDDLFGLEKKEDGSYGAL